MTIAFKTKKLKRILIFLFNCICLTMFVRPAYMERIPGSNKIYTLGSYLCILIIFFYWIVRIIRYHYFNRLTLMICLFTIIPVICTIIQGGSGSLATFRTPLYILALTLLIDYNLRNHFDMILLSIVLLIGSYIIINFATIILYPKGLYSTEVYMYSNWFLGYKNVMVRYMIPVLTATAILEVYFFKRLAVLFYGLYTICLASNILGDSKTGLTGLVVFGVILIFFQYRRIPVFINLKNLVISILILNIGITLFNALSLLGNYFFNIGEQGSMNNRFLIWKTALSLIEKKPLLGYGFCNSERMKKLLDITTSRGVAFTHPHNYYLYIAIQGGVVIFVLLMLIYMRIARNCLKDRDNFLAVAVLAMYSSFLTMGVSESLVGAVLMYPMMLLSEYITVYTIYPGKHRSSGEGNDDEIFKS